MKQTLFSEVRWKKYVALLIVLILLTPFFYWSNRHLTVSYYTISHTDLPADFDGFRIVQLSDLHNATFGENDRDLVGQVTKLQPDVIVLTGDMVDASNHTDYDKALMLMRQLPSIAPTYYVYGNHELCLPKDEMGDFVSLAEVCGVQYLDNEMVDLTADGGESITLIGLNDNSLQSFILDDMMKTQDHGRFQLLLAHEPQFLPDYAQTGVDLVLSGHAHGGQFRLPLIGGIYAPDQGFFPKLTEGVHTKDQTSMVISRGLGNSGFPLRLFNQPEIVCITLKSETQT